jgi:hypothetical protein
MYEEYGRGWLTLERRPTKEQTLQVYLFRKHDDIRLRPEPRAHNPGGGASCPRRQMLSPIRRPGRDALRGHSSTKRFTSSPRADQPRTSAVVERRLSEPV